MQDDVVQATKHMPVTIKRMASWYEGRPIMLRIKWGPFSNLDLLVGD